MCICVCARLHRCVGFCMGVCICMMSLKGTSCDLCWLSSLKFQQRMDNIIAASKQDLALCPGLGPQKVVYPCHGTY